MIKVIYQADDHEFRYLEVSGHAESGEYGKDLICAAVSSIMFGLMNGLDILADDQIVIEQEANRIVIQNDGNSAKASDYLELAMIQLRTIEESYQQYIKIKRKELL